MGACYANVMLLVTDPVWYYYYYVTNKYFIFVQQIMHTFMYGCIYVIVRKHRIMNSRNFLDR